VKPKPTLFLTRVMHRREFPVAYRFEYRVFSLLLDVGALEQTASAIPFFSVDRNNLLSFHRRDHGPRDGSDLREWATGLLAARGIDLRGGHVYLLCFPRILGYGFNPLSLWYCYHRDGSLRGVICEVNNTFGEHHFYVIDEHGDAMTWPVRAVVRKCFHVSPLMGMDAEYHFRIRPPTDAMSLVIRQFDHGRLALAAAQWGEARPLSSRSLLKALARTPLMTFKIMAAIHWQALKIWLRGAPFFPKPKPPEQQVT
jgi:DUF1365 family protein